MRITIKWKDINHSSRWEKTFDDTIGYGVAHGFKLGVLQNNVTLESQAAYNLLTQPIWGSNADKAFAELIPVMEPEPWRSEWHFDITTFSIVTTENPEWYVWQSKRAAQFVEYLNLLKNNLTLLGNYSFPVIPDGDNYRWWKNGISIPVEVGKYSQSSKWVMVNNLNHYQWQGFVNRTILWVDKDKIIRELLRY